MDSPSSHHHHRHQQQQQQHGQKDEVEEAEADSTIHAFNLTSNITVIEKPPPQRSQPPGEGSDSGVEVADCACRPQDCETLPPSCDSSIISCCSNYEEAYNILVRRNSTLLEDYTLRHHHHHHHRHHADGASEHGSESSSMTGSSSSRNSTRNNPTGNKKKVGVTEPSGKGAARGKPPTTPKPSAVRLKSIDRLQGKGTAPTKKTTPNTLELGGKRRVGAAARPTSATRTPAVTPTDDGRWPSVNSKPAPLMSKSLRAGILDATKIAKTDTKTVEKYATLPRRRKSSDDLKRITSRPNSKVTLAKIPTKKRQKIKIYHEIGQQTALTMNDITKALSGVAVELIDPRVIEKCDNYVQVDMRLKDVEQLQSQLKQLKEKYDNLCVEHKQQSDKLTKTETKLREEVVEKDGLKEELKMTSQRVLAILGEGGNIKDDGNVSEDSLILLESSFQNVSQIVIRQEEEISKLNVDCRTLQIDLDKSMAAERILVQQQHDLEVESVELQEFMQAEKNTLSDALREAETEMNRLNALVEKKDKEMKGCQEECRKLHRVNEHRRQENLGLQARLAVMESKSRELLVHQGSSVSGTAVALSALIGRLDGLVEELVTSYNISEQELEDAIFHNEAYNNSSSNSSPDATPEKSDRFFSEKVALPKKGSSFVSAVINAIKNAAAQNPFAGNRDLSRDNLCTDNSSSTEMLDSETEPCLMMEHVLEDVVVPDGHSHNMISSCHSMLSSQLSHSGSLKDLSQSILNKQMSSSLTTSFTTNDMSISDIFPSLSLVDQVIDVDNLVTRLLKVIRIIQLENDDCMNEIQEDRDSLLEQIGKQKDTNKVVVKQLKDWEVLGARLKTEVKELMHQLSKKNNEMDNIKQELNNQREQVEKLNQDVCELSTALAKTEFDAKIKEELTTEAVRNWENIGQTPTPEILGRLITSQNEVPLLKEKLSDKERQLNDLTQEFLASRHLLTESLKVAVNEAKKQYAAIDSALEVLHNNQAVVQQCKALSDLQRDLENTSFQSASAMPLVTPSDCNANAALLQAIAQIAAPINTTA